MRKIKRYGWKPDLPDHRDLLYVPAQGVALPPKVDLRPWFQPCYDQGQLGSCTGNAWAGVMEYMRLKQGGGIEIPSRLQIYYDERVREGTPGEDSGAMIRDGAWVVANRGAAPESLWPYDISKFAVEPPPEVYYEAQKFEALAYGRLDNTILDDLRGALASGLPVVHGFSVYESFESSAVAASGIVPMPAEGESLLGGHATVIVGYDDETQRFICRNSWGTGWGINGSGYYSIPYAYLTDHNLSDDHWVVELVAGQVNADPHPL